MQPQATTRWIPVALKLAALFAFVALTNQNFLVWVDQFIDQKRFLTLAVFLGLWSVALAAILVAAFQRNLWVRAFWAFVIALSSAAGFGFHQVSGLEISIFDVASLWAARHEASRALDFYADATAMAALVFVAGLLVMAWPVRLGLRTQRVLTRLCWLPAVPVLLFIAVIYVKDGGGWYGMSSQFAPLSVATLSGAKIANNAMPARGEVAWQPGPRKIRHVVLLVDESVRGDYIDLTPGNPYTPDLASLRDRIVNFGPAASGGNCSSYANAILRFGASRHDLMKTLTSNATIWQYAKAAGYRTVFIDAQAAFLRGPAKLQNYMTADEKDWIDDFNAIDSSVPVPELDDRLVDILSQKLKSDQPTFIYAIKNGAHFPYDRDYPSNQQIFRPTMSEAAHDDDAARVNSYRNAIRWAVDRVMKRVIESAPLDDTVVIYTSDHGQNLSHAGLTHCTIENPSPYEGLVPLFAITGQPQLHARFQTAAKASVGHGSHFAIVPTILDLFGYGRSDIATLYGPTLFEKSTAEPAFTSGDIFGLVSNRIRWNPIDMWRRPDDNAAPKPDTDKVGLMERKGGPETLPN